MIKQTWETGARGATNFPFVSAEGHIDRVKRFVDRNDQRETEGPDHERRGAMYDRQSRQPITLQYLITPTRSSRGGPRSLSMDTDHSIRFSIISISLRDILPVDRLNQPSPITGPYLHGSWNIISRLLALRSITIPPSFLPLFKRTLGLSYAFLFLPFQQIGRNHLVLEIKGNTVNRFSVHRRHFGHRRCVQTIPGEEIAGGDVCRACPPWYYHVREPFHDDIVNLLHLGESSGRCAIKILS